MIIWILAIWLLIGVPSVRQMADCEYSKNPFKNMWIRYDKENYNVAGKILLIVGHCVIGLPDIIICYVCYYVVALYDLTKKLFDKNFKKKEK